MKKNITCLIMCAASCAMFAQTSGEEAGHIWIDLGLPSGIKWASTNIGANRPQDEGNYYAWGETTLKTDFRWATYSHGAGQNSLTKYSYSDGVLSLDAADDVVSCVWGGTCQPKRNGGNFKSIVFGHGLTITINQVLQDMWSRPRAVMLHSFCLLQVAVMRA